MMDAMKVQQIGKLAADLVSHGQAPDIQTAMMQAEYMLSKDSQIPLNNQAQMFQQQLLHVILPIYLIATELIQLMRQL